MADDEKRPESDAAMFAGAVQALAGSFERFGDRITSQLGEVSKKLDVLIDETRGARSDTNQRLDVIGARLDLQTANIDQMRKEHGGFLQALNVSQQRVADGIGDFEDVRAGLAEVRQQLAQLKSGDPNSMDRQRWRESILGTDITKTFLKEE